MEKTTITHSNTSIRADTLGVMLFMQSLTKQDKKKSNYQTSKSPFPIHAHILHMIILHLMSYHRSWPCDWSVFNQGNCIISTRKYKTRIANLSNKTLNINNSNPWLLSPEQMHKVKYFSIFFPSFFGGRERNATLI